MAFDTENIIEARTVRTKTLVFEQTAGPLKVQGPGEKFHESVPSGKKWDVTVRIEVNETDE